MTFIKKSFDPISTIATQVLILGSLPGDKSLELQQYYGHPRNRFWKVLSAIHQCELPTTYEEKKAMLLSLNLGVWDVAFTASRKGSLDTAIKEEVPNDLDQFIDQHKELKLIAFNGKKAEALYDKYFKRREGIQYVSLPSTSPANAGITFGGLCAKWRQLLPE